MKLTVNGVPIKVIDHIEVVIEVPIEGDILLNGIDIILKGGVLHVKNDVNSHTIYVDYQKLQRQPNDFIDQIDAYLRFNTDEVIPDENGVKLYIDKTP